MTVPVDLSAAEFRRFSMFDTLKRRKMWCNPLIFAVILCISAVICLSMDRIRGGTFLGVVLLTVGLGLPCAYFLSFLLSVNQQIRQMGLARPKRVYTLTFGEQDKLIHIVNEKDHLDYPWKKVHHVYRDLTATYLYVTPRQAFILPDTSLEVEPEELLTLIRRKISPEKYTEI